MAENEASFKQVGDIYKTSGEILRTGSYIAQSGNKVDISLTDVDDLYSNIDEHIPMGIAHPEDNDPNYFETLGYAIKLAKLGDAISHDGIVFDSYKFDNVVLKGYNAISPEIEFVKDANGKIIGKKITRLAFVKNPAIDTNTTSITRFAFSAPNIQEEVPKMSETPATPEPMKQPEHPFTANDSWAAKPPETSAAQPDITELMKNMAAAITNGITEKMGSQIEALQNEINALKTTKEEPVVDEEPKDSQPIVVNDKQELPPGVFEQFAELNRQKQELQTRVEREEKQRYTEKLAELRSLGQATPEKLVSHLGTYEQKIATLDAFKSAMVKNTPMNSENAKPMSTEGGSKPDNPMTVYEVAKSLRMKLTPERAAHYAKEWGIPLQ